MPRAFATLVGMSASAICFLEDADYESHSMAMLNRIAEALNKRAEICFVSIRSPKVRGASNEQSPSLRGYLCFRRS